MTSSLVYMATSHIYCDPVFTSTYCIGTRTECQSHVFFESDESVVCDPNMTLAVAACGEQQSEEALNLVLSARMFSNCSFTLHLFATADTVDEMTSQLSRLFAAPVFLRTATTFVVHETKYPARVDKAEWTNMSPCTMLRLFLPVRN